jgi:ATP-dependent RNA helicase RhlE
MPGPIVQLSRELLKNPVRVDVERKQAPATGITQALFPVPSRRKPDLLIELLRRDEIGNVIVFCRTKHRANRLFEKLEKAGISATRMHGNRSQAQRTNALEGLPDGTYRVLCATDIVARGIDVEALDHVVNFDVPAQPEDYIHRVGRTARAGATGEAYTFVAPEEESEVPRHRARRGPRAGAPQGGGLRLQRPEQERFEVPWESGSPPCGSSAGRPGSGRRRRRPGLERRWEWLGAEPGERNGLRRLRWERILPVGAWWEGRQPAWGRRGRSRRLRTGRGGRG